MSAAENWQTAREIVCAALGRGEFHRSQRWFARGLLILPFFAAVTGTALLLVWILTLTGNL
jgi:hypothetical protein